MSGVLDFLTLFVAIFGFLLLVGSWIRAEISMQVDELESRELRRLEAVGQIRDEMKSSSHRLLAAAIDPEIGEFKVVDARDFEPEGESS